VYKKNMDAAGRTYSFRADADLGDRIERARATLAVLGEALESPENEWITRELQLVALRRSRELAASANRSELMRATMELLVATTETIAEDLRFTEEYARAARARTTEDEEFLEPAQRAGAQLWRDE
jgi:hypothetical protein